ncbi:type I-E CRISPR-associated protein Cas5/CasD [Actinomadura sp. NBRC 104412]|uniref:type I-E CRISPR-associated protein Cas5/CasD n=1 Tax=Actinomadura sp. NBRC 104412 TaxID=3032203 RepID=UPI0024A1D340|nr:type I-E CRISPR-associated protein Cas5/CasD [Actinomadura sp. NBRC 104412]GLZ09191.1 type I-E CRISPR-associated protein Cas5/CasD [Actinomadura sp. NBRC 104412]
MSVLILCLAGPLQSWGIASRHNTRSTRTAPTKSAVIGLLASALGRPRGADLSDLAAHDFGVRVDQPGELLVDYHIVTAASHSADPALQRLPTAAGSTLRPHESTKVTRRHYLTDAVFVAALQGPLTDPLAEALQAPRHPPYLGRRSCPPSRPILLANTDRYPTVKAALEGVEWQAGPAERRRHRTDDHVTCEIIIDDRNGDHHLTDVPLHSPPYQRRFGSRRVRHESVRIPAHPTNPSHDPMDLLG